MIELERPYELYEHGKERTALKMREITSLAIEHRVVNVTSHSLLGELNSDRHRSRYLWYPIDI